MQRTGPEEVKIIVKLYLQQIITKTTAAEVIQTARTTLPALGEQRVPVIIKML